MAVLTEKTTINRLPCEVDLLLFAPILSVPNHGLHTAKHTMVALKQDIQWLMSAARRCCQPRFQQLLHFSPPPACQLRLQRGCRISTAPPAASPAARALLLLLNLSLPHPPRLVRW